MLVSVSFHFLASIGSCPNIVRSMSEREAARPLQRIRIWWFGYDFRWLRLPRASDHAIVFAGLLLVVPAVSTTCMHACTGYSARLILFFYCITRACRTDKAWLVNEHCSTAMLIIGQVCRKCTRHCHCVCGCCALCRDDWRCLENLPCTPGRLTDPELRKEGSWMDGLFKFQASGRARLRYLLYYLLTRPPFLIIMNLPIGHTAGWAIRACLSTGFPRSRYIPKKDILSPSWPPSPWFFAAASCCSSPSPFARPLQPRGLDFGCRPSMLCLLCDAETSRGEGA